MLTEYRDHPDDLYLLRVGYRITSYNVCYTKLLRIHKIMDGLYHVYQYCGNEKALEVEKKLGDWVGTIVNGLTDEQLV